MAGLHHYSVHGLLLSSPARLPIPEADPGSVDVEYRIDLQVGAVHTSRHSRTDDPDDPWFVEHWIDENVVVDFPGWASFEVGHHRITLRSDDTSDDDLVAHLLLDHVVPRLVALRGDLMLHAAGVVGPSGSAHLFLGPSGTGKSTLAAALAAVGWPLLDDDGVRVIALQGAWHAVPGYEGIRLLPDAASAVAPNLSNGRPMAAGHRKHRYPIDGTTIRMAEEPAPIGHIYVVKRGGETGPGVARMSFAEGIAALTEHAFHLTDEPSDLTRNAFERAAAVAGDVPVGLLQTPNGLDTLHRVVAALSDVDAKLS